MKINEVITEAVNQNTGTPNPEQSAPEQPAQQPAQKKPGLWDRIKSKFTGPDQQQQISQGIGAQANQARIRTELRSFNQYLSQVTSGKTITPELLQTAAKNFIAKRYPDVDPDVLAQVTKVTDVNSANQVVAQGYNSMMANMMNEPEDVPQATPSGKAQSTPAQQTPAGIIVPPSVGAGPRKTAAPDAEQQTQQAQQQVLAQGISVVSNEPIILRNKAGKEFGLNDKGQWIHLSSGKIPAEAYQAFLSQQHDISLGLK